MGGVVTVRYWAGARELAGTTSESVGGDTLTTVLAAVMLAHGPRMGALLSKSVLLVDGERVDGDSAATLHEGSTVEVLPPFAGGAR